MSGARSRPAIPMLKKDGVNYTTNKEKAELLGKYFSGVSSNSLLFMLCVLLYLDVRKSQARGRIPSPTRSLRSSRIQACLPCWNCLTGCGMLPVSWKNSIVVPVLKPEKPPHEGNSYRPIALASVLCKLMKRLVTDRLTWHMEVNHLFNDRCNSGRGATYM